MAADWIKQTDFAHRGLHGIDSGCPENSLAAIEAAVDRGYGIEIDIQRSADYEAIVFHDTTLNRLTDTVGPVAGRQSGELCKTRLGDSAETIPTLRQVLDLVAGRAPLLVEIKSSPGPAVPGVLEQRVATLLQDYRGPVAAMALSPNPIAWLGVLSPQLALGNVVSRAHRAGPVGRVLRGATKLARRIGAGSVAKSDFVAVDLELLEDKSLQQVRQRDKPLLTWTVCSAEEAERARKSADGIIFEGFEPAQITR